MTDIGYGYLAREQALLFGRVKRVSQERASKRRSRKGQASRVLARLTSLAQIGELVRRLSAIHPINHCFVLFSFMFVCFCFVLFWIFVPSPFQFLAPKIKKLSMH